MIFILNFFRSMNDFKNMNMTWGKYPTKTNHSLLEIFRQTDHVTCGDRYASDPIHQAPDHRRS